MYSCGPGQQAVALAAGGGAGGSCVSVHLGEMYAEEERELLVEVRTPLQHNQVLVVEGVCGGWEVEGDLIGG